jgi:hypothetical protein
LAGQRFDDGADRSTVFLQEFKLRAKELLLRSYRVLCGDEKALDIHFEPSANRLWFEIYNEIEEKQQPGKEFDGMKDHASKIMDIMSRVAANMHLFEGYKGGISEQTLLSAKEICFYCADYYYSQFVQPPEAVRDAIIINDYLNRHYRATNLRLAKKSDVRNGIGIKGLRLALRFEPAFLQLKSQCVVGELRQKVRGRKEVAWIDLCPGQDFNFNASFEDWYFV